MRALAIAMAALALVACEDERGDFEERLTEMRAESARLAASPAPDARGVEGLDPLEPQIRVVATLDAVHVDDTWPFAVRWDRDPDAVLAGTDAAQIATLLPRGVRQAVALREGQGDLLQIRLLSALPPAAPAPPVPPGGLRPIRPGPPLGLHADPRIPFATIEAIACAAHNAGYAHLDLTVRQGDEPRAFRVNLPRRYEPGAPADDSSSYQLEMLLRYEGITFSTFGGVVAPGCATATRADGPTIPRDGDGYDDAALRRCLRTMKREMLSEHEVWVRADARIPFGEVVRAMLMTRGNAEERLFPDPELCAPRPR